MRNNKKKRGLMNKPVGDDFVVVVVVAKGGF